MFNREGKVQEGKSPSSLLFQSISPSSLLFEAISPSSLSFLAFRASPLHQHTARRFLTTVCHAYEDFYGEKPCGVLQGILGRGLPPRSQILTLFRTKKCRYSHPFQTRPLKNSVIITVMIRFSTFLPISAPFQISAPIRVCFC